MSRRNKRKSNRREQAPKPPFKRRLPPPDECRLGTEPHESKKPRLEYDEDLPVQCADCARWYSTSDLNEDGLCDDCLEEWENDYGEEG